MNARATQVTLLVAMVAGLACHKPKVTADGGVPECTAGQTKSCYSGPAGTDGVGACHAGVRTCTSAGTFGACVGEALPHAELCTADSVDQDCNGTADDVQDVDADGDGWSLCSGDCCDSTADCANPALVNPGAYDSAGNGVDDDCSGSADDAQAACDASLVSNSDAGVDSSKAMELCQTTVESAPLAERRWGVISSELSLTSGSGTPYAGSHAIRPAFGSVPVQAGQSLLVLSTGAAAAPGQVNPAYAAFQTGTVQGTNDVFPSDFLAANNNTLPNAPGCPALAGTKAQDPVMLTVRLRVPTNAKSFQLKAYFLSSEYPEYVCSAFNDFFVALLDSSYAGAKPNPMDKNLAVATLAGGGQYPVGVNLAHGDTGLFRQCENGTIGCQTGATSGTITTCLSTTELAGTGFELASTGCGANDLVGGGTGWLHVAGNVVPGEVATLRLAIWDTSDGQFDSVVLLDDFRWNADEVTPGASL